MTSLEFRKELNVLQDVLEQVGYEYLLPRWGKTTNPNKTSQGWVCEEDDGSAERIHERLNRKFPTDGKLIEELFKKGIDGRKQSNRVWVIDPLDSSRKYIGVKRDESGEDVIDPNAIGEDWGLIGALMIDNIPVVAVTLKPAKKELAYAVNGQGAFMKVGYTSSPIYVSPTTDPHVIISRHRGGDELERMVSALDPKHITRMSGSLRIIEVAAGRANVFIAPPESITHTWDVCGPSLILEEAINPILDHGGTITDVYGNPLRHDAEDCVNRYGIVVTNGILHEKGLEYFRNRERNDKS
jgi:3'(2'), 5'-bisphosphate nucleotidase